MFERYTEKARRVIFFARYEASHYGSPEIDSEHLLLGLLQENKTLHRWLPKATPVAIRERIDECSLKRPMIPTSVDLPLSRASQRILKYAAEDAERLVHRHIGTEDLFLGLLDEADCFAASLLRDAGADANSIRVELAKVINESLSHRSYSISGAAVEIHGVPRSASRVRDDVQSCRMYNWQWEKRAWTNVNVVIAKKTGKISSDLGLAEDSQNFELVKGGWKKDHCFICGWELFESKDDAEHGIGYTNGRHWICTECYTKFWEHPQIFPSPYSDMT